MAITAPEISGEPGFRHAPTRALVSVRTHFSTGAVPSSSDASPERRHVSETVISQQLTGWHRQAGDLHSLPATMTPIPETPAFVVTSHAMTELLAMAERAAASPAKVLITGESGVGKDVVARYIHSRSARKAAPFVAVNCAGVTETLLESELFGHVKGSFTGAYRDKRGKTQLAHRGTLFLDEVGEMSLRMQALLLRFLENGEVHAVGSDQPQTHVYVRVIAATNRNLTELVAAGQFREDLYYRLCVIHLRVPPLRERPEDVQELMKHFL